MKKISIVFLLALLVSVTAFPQAIDFPLGKVNYGEVSAKSFALDTGARAIMLAEAGHAYRSSMTGELTFIYYAKIKILTKKGLDLANFSVYLPRSSSDKSVKATLLSVEGATYNIEKSSMVSTKFDEKKIFTENLENGNRAKFTFPNVREGSVIEIKYKTQTPFLYNFKTWVFQSDIPKVKSEYWSLVPGNYVYNIALRGYKALAMKQSSLVKGCFDNGNGTLYDCELTHYMMKDIPAFVSEDYMTAQENFISALYYELREIRRPDGTVEKLTREWKDVEKEMNDDESFGKQIKRAKELFAEKVKVAVGSEADALMVAKVVYKMIADHFTWNESVGLFADLGVKKAFDTRKGNDADINLCLVAALQNAGLEAYPVILSTRDNGLPIDLYPVISEFNYVIATVTINNVTYLLDATSKLFPFGFLPLRCLNGKGRLLAKESSWILLKSRDKYKTWTTLDVTLGDEGVLKGKATVNSQGYDARDKRIEILAAESQEAYVKALQKEWGDNVEIRNYSLENLHDIQKPVIEKMEVTITLEDLGGGKTVFISPILLGRIADNPFKSSERLYPVDFGAPVEHVLFMSLAYPATATVDELPKNEGLSLPEAGGKYLFNVNAGDQKLSITSNLSLTKAQYSSAEYHNLKELYARIIQIQQGQIVLKRN